MRPFQPLFDRFAGRPPGGEKPPGEQGLDLLGPEFLTDPYPFYAYLRRHQPVHRTRQGSWLLTGHAMQVEAFSNPALGNAPSNRAVIHYRNAHKYTSASVARNILPFLDPPLQIKPRRIVGSVFRATLRDAPPDLEAAAAIRLHGLAGKAQVDLIGDYAQPLSVWAISYLMGLPEADAGQLSEWAAQFFFLFAPMPSQAAREATDAGLDDFRAYLHDCLAKRRASPGADIISRLLMAEDDDGGLSDQQIVDNCMLLFADGVENIGRGFANTMLALHRHPAQWEKLTAGPQLANAAILEGLRYDPPAQMIGRIAREDVELGGQTIKKESALLLAVASANRDPSAFPDPDVYDLSRADEGLLTFGRGRHSCIGAPLVRLEMEGAMKTLVRATRRIEIDDRSLSWEARLGHRWLKALPARLTFR